ncbi:MAG: D-2-hydroxyacid dehydrogenase [Verrucomicrobia bacterium]|jgi:glycerate dehydrogenase|nr:D-2-hydroxyacid dehydrogenase [Verrucomicrobiota bacterium]
MKIVVLDADTLGFERDAWDGLAGIGDLVLRPNTGHSAEAVLAEVKGAEVVLTNKVPLRREVLEKLDQLKLISVLATGTNNIDLGAAKSCGITVCNVPAYSSASVAQQTVALLLELCNHCGLHSESVHAGDWVRSPHFCYWKKPLIELTGRTVGLVGFGDIGRRTGAILHAMGARVQACVRQPRDTPDWEGFRWVERETLFETSDIVSLHCPETPETRGFIDAALLRSMKPGALLINTARGSLIDEAALASALQSGQLGGAALDVVASEPMRPDNPLLGAQNCIITPHLAWASEPSRRRLLAATQGNIEGFIGNHPQNLVA